MAYSSIKSFMSSIPEENWERAFGKKNMRVILEKQDSHKVIESEFDSHTRYNEKEVFKSFYVDEDGKEHLWTKDGYEKNGREGLVFKPRSIGASQMIDRHLIEQNKEAWISAHYSVPGDGTNSLIEQQANSEQTNENAEWQKNKTQSPKN